MPVVTKPLTEIHKRSGKFLILLLLDLSLQTFFLKLFINKDTYIQKDEHSQADNFAPQKHNMQQKGRYAKGDMVISE